MVAAWVVLVAYSSILMLVLYFTNLICCETRFALACARRFVYRVGAFRAGPAAPVPLHYPQIAAAR